MNRNLVLAVLLSSAVYIFWYSYVAKPVPPPQTAVQEGQAQPAEKPRPAQPAAGTAAPMPRTTVTSDWPKNSVTLDLPKASYSFHPSGASIKSIVYQGPVSPVEFVLNPSPGFLGSSDDLPFAFKSRTTDSVTFAAHAPNGVRVIKKFTLAGDDKINLLEN